MSKRSRELTPDDDSAQPPGQSIRQREFNLVGDECALYSIFPDRLDSVAMSKLREGAADLLVAEMAVPFKLSDPGEPAYAAGNPANGLKAEENLRTCARGNTPEPAGWVLRRGTLGRRLEPRVFNARLEMRWHEVGQIGRVREEGKDKLDGQSEPLPRFKTLGHGSDGNSTRLRAAHNRRQSINVEEMNCWNDFSPEGHD